MSLFDYSKMACPHIVFSDGYDINLILGKQDDPYDRERIKKEVYIGRIYRLSNELLNRRNVHPIVFFDNMQELEDMLVICPYKMKNYDAKREYAYYLQQKEKVISDFLNRSFKHAYEVALERKTIKGKVNQIDNWFDKMEYYKQYMSSINIKMIDDMYINWSNEKNKMEKG